MLTEATTASLLTAAAMRDAEARAIANGTSGWEMMQRAGEAVAEVIMRSYPPMPVRVLCGPGNNGGDGFITASALKRAGWEEVVVGCLVDRSELQGDARQAADLWKGNCLPLAEISIEPDMLVVDALFGTGLSKPLEGEAALVMERIALAGAALVAIDILSGIDSESGRFSGILPNAYVTVTFGARKPGHLLMPGALISGIIACVDIGIAPYIEEAAASLGLLENRAETWLNQFHWPLPGDHKYLRGSVVVHGGRAEMSGASRLAAMAALRAGAGASTVASDREALLINAAHLTSVMTAETNTPEEFGALIRQEKHNAIVLGPGAGRNERTRACVLSSLASAKATVLDADALTVFEEDPQTLFAAVSGPAIITPHAGELERLFKTLALDMSQAKWRVAREAAALSGMVTVYKGFDTVIAAPDGRIAINSNGTPLLATAGSGDVLSGMIGSFCAQGMPAFEAACAAVYIHAEAGRNFGLGLIAEDLPQMIPAVLNSLWNM